MQCVFRRSLTQPSKTAVRRGVAAVELAIILPVLLLLVVGIVETCNLIYLKQSLTVSAYEGARAAIANLATNASVSDRANQVVADRSLRNAVIRVTPADFPARPYGTWLTVEVSAPYGANSLMPGWFFSGLTIRGRVTMMKEF